jgi:predicted 3-demethylubiquinone-9 3-methyltransferase (glyoxalase superfamily)
MFLGPSAAGMRAPSLLRRNFGNRLKRQSGKGIILKNPRRAQPVKQNKVGNRLYRSPVPMPGRRVPWKGGRDVNPHSKNHPLLWFDNQAEEAAVFYTSIFKNSRIGKMTRYGKEGFTIHGRPEGTVMTVEFELDGQAFTALNGGPIFKFNEAVSFQVHCETQEEVDYYWEKLSKGGDEKAQQCGWLKDQYGLSWQIVPRILGELLNDPDPEKSQRTMKAMLQMKKINLTVA